MKGKIKLNGILQILRGKKYTDQSCFHSDMYYC